MSGIVWVAIGGAAGAASRYLLSLALARAGMPTATLVANVLGCVLLGVFVHWFTVRELVWWQQSGRLLLATGFCGAFTTMSALALETQQFYALGQSGSAAIYAFSSVVLSLAGLCAGLWVARLLV